jgi:hypothetical protein
MMLRLAWLRRHSKNLNTDAWRKMQLWRHTSSGAHPFNRFSTGNINTLLHTPKAGLSASSSSLCTESSSRLHLLPWLVCSVATAATKHLGGRRHV